MKLLVGFSGRSGIMFSSKSAANLQQMGCSSSSCADGTAAVVSITFAAAVAVAVALAVATAAVAGAT